MWSQAKTPQRNHTERVGAELNLDDNGLWNNQDLWCLSPSPQLWGQQSSMLRHSSRQKTPTKNTLTSSSRCWDSIPLYSMNNTGCPFKKHFSTWDLALPLSKNTYKPSSTGFRCFYNPVLKYPIHCKTNCFRPSRKKVTNSLSWRALHGSAHLQHHWKSRVMFCRSPLPNIDGIRSCINSSVVCARKLSFTKLKRTTEASQNFLWSSQRKTILFEYFGEALLYRLKLI